MQNLCFGCECTILRDRSCENGFAPNASILLHQTQDDVWVCFEALRNVSECKKMQNLCFGSECTISGYRSCENDFPTNAPIYSIRSKMMFGSILEHFVNLPRVKRCKTCVSGLNALFRGYSSCENGFAPNAAILLHWTQNDFQEYFGAFRNPSTCENMQNLCFRTECTISGYSSC